MQPTKRAQLAIFFTVFVDLLGFGIVIPILPLYLFSAWGVLVLVSWIIIRGDES